jgi:ABC-type ATPase with predicted acetyltransferase domain
MEEMSKLDEFRPVADASKIRIQKNIPIIDTVGRDFSDALKKLSLAGLNEAYLFLRRFDELSDGQKYRYRIARLIDSGVKTWVLDEFTSVLDRVTARVVAYCLQKAARKMGATVLAATTHTDVAEDLNPDIIVRKGMGPYVSVEYRRPESRECSILRDVIIEVGERRDYDVLKHFHYLGGLPGWIRRIYRAKVGDEVAGVIVYVAPSLFVRGRYKAFPHLKELQKQNVKEYAKFISSNFTRIARVIVHPKYRSIGLGVKLVKETMPLIGTRYVETLAVMARYNPFFEKAGMKRVDIPPPKDQILEQIEAMGVKIVSRSWRKTAAQLEKLPKQQLRKLNELCIKRLEHLDVIDSKTQPSLLNKLKSGVNIEAMAKSLVILPFPAVYLYWDRDASQSNNS